jgi:hypothetical protein
MKEDTFFYHFSLNMPHLTPSISQNVQTGFENRVYCGLNNKQLEYLLDT